MRRRRRHAPGALWRRGAGARAPEDVEQLLTVLASLTGGSVPVQVVLEVARTHQAWTEAWVDTLSGVSADGFQLRFVAATAGDEDAL